MEFYLEEIQKRYDHPLSISLDEFEELRGLAEEAIRCTPATIMADCGNRGRLSIPHLALDGNLHCCAGMLFLMGRALRNLISTQLMIS